WVQALPISIRPARAASLSLAGTPSSRVPSRTSTVGAIWGTFATIFGFDGGRKWIIRDGRNGISRTGSGAPTASGRKKSLGGRSAPHRTRTTRIAPTRQVHAIPPGPPASRAQHDHEANGMRPRLRAGRRFRLG